MAETLASLVAELRTMPDRDRRAILRALTVLERDAVEQAMTSHGDAADDAPFERSETFSPSFANCIAAARTGQSSTLVATMTVAASRALLAAADALDPARAPVARPGSPASGRSLLDAFGGMLSPRNPRP